MKKQKTWLPIFTGFYGSVFDVSDYFIEQETEFKEYYPELHKVGISKQYFDRNFYDYLDFKKGYEGAAEYICNSLINIDTTDIIKDVDYEELVSPKFYNFSTDSINCTITYDNKKLFMYLKKHKTEFEKYLEKTYTSRDGFSSSYPNDLNYWMDEINHKEHEIGAIFQFILMNESEDAVMDLYYESNCSEGFSNSVNFDHNKMIQDFLKK